MATDPSGSVGKAYPGISSSTGVPYPVPDEQVTLRPSLLSGSGEVFTPQPYTHEEMMMNDGLEPQHAPAGREETQASSELPGLWSLSSKTACIRKALFCWHTENKAMRDQEIWVLLMLWSV